MHWIFLQAAQMPADTLSDVTESEVKTITLMNLVLEGGWAMIPLALLLVLGVYIFIERYMTIKKANADPEPLMRQIEGYVRAGDLNRALMVCESNPSPFSRMVSKGIRRLGAPMGDVMASIENEAKLEVNRLEKKLSIQ